MIVILIFHFRIMVWFSLYGSSIRGNRKRGLRSQNGEAWMRREKGERGLRWETDMERKRSRTFFRHHSEDMRYGGF